MTWVTRPSIHIDRAASAWLISRFIDAQGAYVLVVDLEDAPKDAIPFDIVGVEFGHQGAHCTFETLLTRYTLDDPVLWRIGQIVHEADLDDGRFDAPEAAGFDVALRGLSMLGDDDLTLRVSGSMFDGLHQFFHRELLLGRTPG